MAPRRTRAQYSKSVGGCQTCKIRHVKCDETLPQCQRCLSTGRTCDGPRLHRIIIVQHQSHQTQKQYSPVLAPFDFTPWLVSAQERRAFAFYLEKAAPNLSGPIDAALWMNVLPQLAASDSIVRHAILAISHFVEHPVRYDIGNKIVVRPLTRKHVVGLRWQAQALSADKDQTRNLQTMDLMLRCLLFPSLEFQHNNFLTGLKLLRTSFHILAPLLTAPPIDSCSSAMQNHLVVRTMMPMYMRNASLLFTSWTEFDITVSKSQTLAEVESAAFLLLCITFGMMKDVLMVLRKCQSREMTELKLKMEDLEAKSNTLISSIQQTSSHSMDNTRRLQALKDYCICVHSWLQILLRHSTYEVAINSDKFMTIILDQCRLIQVDAEKLYPAASRTAYFYECIIGPPAYLVAVFAPNGNTRNQALRLMKQKEIEPSNHQLHALILARDGGDPYGTSENSALRSFQIYYGAKDPDSGRAKVFEITV